MNPLQINRGTGRTTKMLREVADKAKTAARVIVIVRHHPMIAYSIKLLASQGLVHRVTHDGCHVGACRVTFMVYTDDLAWRLKGQSNSTPVFIDHDVRSMSDADKAKA